MNGCGRFGRVKSKFAAGPRFWQKYGMKLLLVLLMAAPMLVVSVQAQASDKAKAKTEKREPGAKFKNVGVEEFDKLREKKENVVLDVRTKEEYEAGHMPGAVWIDFMEPDFAEKVGKLDKNKTYLVHCASGGRSARACKKMEGMDFGRLYNLQGGMKAWEKAGKPVEKGKE